MDSDPVVVVGIPTYNNEGDIDSTLALLERQSRQPDRVVFCDKSTDRTPAIIRDWAETVSFEVEIIEQEGDGVADAYDTILSHLNDEYDLFVTLQTEITVDDEWLRLHVDTHLKHPDIGMVTGDNKWHDPTDREVTSDERPYYVGRNFSAKQGVLESINGWDSNFLRGEDWDMRIRLAGAGVRCYARTELGYEWQQEPEPYVTLSKAKRKPTSLTFLSKFGQWYLRFHPSHVIADILSVGAVTTGALAILTLPFPVSSLLWGALTLLLVTVYWIAHVVLRGHVQGDWGAGIVRKQLLNGIAVFYAARRLAGDHPEWNRTGFDPEETPNFKF
jgi:glycosyltransferase involved in cell wall biosynthesis